MSENPYEAPLEPGRPSPPFIRINPDVPRWAFVVYAGFMIAFLCACGGMLARFAASFPYLPAPLP